MPPISPAQVPPPPPTETLQFEVASIKPHLPGCVGGPGARSGIDEGKGLIQIENLPLRAVIQFAYGIKNYQFEGPSWLANVCYDITAKPPVEYQRTQFRPLMQKLLADRFGLAAHHGSQTVPAYALVLAKGASKLPQAAGPRGFFTVRPGLIQGQAVSMKEIASAISGQVQSPVVDETGLTSVYDVKLEWTSDQPATLLSPADGPVPLPEAGPSISTALREQLGLALKTTKTPVDVIVVDSIHRTPTEN